MSQYTVLKGKQEEDEEILTRRIQKRTVIETVLSVLKEEERGTC